MYANSREAVAYDFLMFDDSRREEQKKRERAPRVVAERPKEKIKVNIGTLFTSLIAAVAVVSVLCSYVELTETKASINSIKKELGKAQETQTRLTMELEKKNDLVEIEEYAVNKLGMVPVRDYQIEYVRVEGEDKAEVIKTDDGISAEGILENATRSFNVALEYLK